ncbi:MAG: CPBP family intramembrane metalloprotease [Oscillospiraceae bacterium]|nr:CPBP family intramembrane metalloprotease [Oscillospiraceae bacterium]
MDHDYRLRLRRHYGRLGFALFCYLALTALTQLGLQLLVLRWAPELTGRGWYEIAAAMLPMYLIAFPIFVLLLPPAPPRELLVRGEALRLRELAVFFLMALGILYPGNILGLGTDALLGKLLRAPAMGNPLETLAVETDLWPYVLGTILLAPILEELTFRKLLLDRMRTIDKPAALFFSALAFGLFHGNVIQFFYAFGVGLLFGVIYMKTGRIAYTIALHVLVNAVGSLAGLLFLRFVDPSDPFSALVPALLMGCWVIVLLAGSVAGIVLLLTRRRSLRVADGQDLLGPGSRFVLPFLNPGWILYLFAALAVMLLRYF